MRKIRAGDAVVIAAVLALAVLTLLFSFFPRRAGKRLTIFSDGRQESYPLTEDREIPLSANGYSLIVKIEDGKAYVLSSTCPDKVCIRSGPLSKQGDTAVCLPAGILLKIDRGGDADEDAVAG